MPTYQVVILGLKPGQNRDEALERLAATFKQPVERLSSLVNGTRAVVKRGADISLAAKLQAAIEAAGFEAVVEPEVSEASIASAQAFSQNVKANAPAAPSVSPAMEAIVTPTAPRSKMSPIVKYGGGLIVACVALVVFLPQISTKPTASSPGGATNTERGDPRRNECAQATTFQPGFCIDQSTDDTLNRGTISFSAGRSARSNALLSLIRNGNETLTQRNFDGFRCELVLNVAGIVGGNSYSGDVTCDVSDSLQSPPASSGKLPTKYAVGTNPLIGHWNLQGTVYSFDKQGAFGFVSDTKPVTGRYIIDGDRYYTQTGYGWHCRTFVSISQDSFVDTDCKHVNARHTYVRVVK